MNFIFDPQLLFFGAGNVSDKLLPDFTIILQTLFFLFSYYMLSRYLFPPVLEVLLKRQKMIDEAQQELKEVEAKGQEKEELYASKIKEARQEAQRIHKEARQEAAAKERELTEAARQEAIKKLRQKETEIQEKAEELRQSLEKDRASLAQDIAEKLLGRKITD